MRPSGFVLALLTLLVANGFLFFSLRDSSLRNGRGIFLNTQNHEDEEDENAWWDNANKIYDKTIEQSKFLDSNEINLFDQLQDRSNFFRSLGPDDSSISTQTLRDIAESYMFSLSYLGDYLCELGVEPPIDVDVQIGDLVTSEQAYILLEALTTLDPYEANIDYDSVRCVLVLYSLHYNIPFSCSFSTLLTISITMVHILTSASLLSHIHVNHVYTCL